MKITSFGLSVPAATIGTVTSSLGVRDVAMASNTIPATGYMIVATSSNTMEWQDARAFGSNTADVSSVGTMGASASNTRADHVHRGVHLVSAAGSNSLYGDVNLVAGTGMAITTAGQSITLASTASGAPTTADYLVGTAQAGLSAEIVVGATPGGELGGTWASPTVDGTHSGSAHILDHTHAVTGQGATGGGATLAPGTFTVPGGGKFSAGSSFPGSPATYDLCFRADLLRQYVYDGTRWLSETLFTLDLTNIAGAQPYSVDTDALYGVVPTYGGAVNVWLDGLSWAAQVNTTNDASNYWTLTFRKAPSFATIVAPNTSGLGIGTWPTAPTYTAIAALTGTSSSVFSLYCTRTGGPGVLYVSATLAYRLVAT